MSTEHIIIPEIVTPDMIRDAVAESFVYGDATEERALELLTDEEIAAVAGLAEGEDAEQAPEVETAEEVSLKNGVYQEIRQKLNERFSVPLEEIAFAHDADTPVKKAALYKAVNSGRVRVLIGSTGKMGTGVNVQRRLIALHHVDQPWKPAELEQREGRILRQGNIYPEVFIFNYVTTKSFDGYMLQTLESKARFISQIMAGEVTARTAEDVGDMVLSVAQVKAIASGNPLVQRRIELEVQLVKLDRLRAAYYNNRAQMREELEQLPVDIVTKRAELSRHRQAIEVRQPLAEETYDIKLRQNLGEGAEDRVFVGFDKRERAGAHIRFLTDLVVDRLRRAASRRQITEEIGSYRGFRVCIHASGNSRLAQASSLFNFQTEIHLYPDVPSGSEDGAPLEVFYVAQIGESNVGITQSIDWQLRHLEDRVEQTEGMIRNLEARLLSVTEEVERPWAHAREYRRLRRAYGEMGSQLQADGVAIEANTTFTTDAEDDGADDGDAAETVAAATDEAAARQNPYTGLEEWGIVVEEMSRDDEEAAGEGRGEAASLFDPVAGDARAGATPVEDEFDVFPASTDETGDEATPLNETVGADDRHQECDSHQETSVADIFGEPDADETMLIAAVAISTVSRRAKKQRRATVREGASPQTSFLFG
ncbi:MAG: hypothetical protein M3430_04085 [Acidobacteriota bacterium]|nr:hypothetical protein [Acidobacteriota bacterium]